MCVPDKQSIELPCIEFDNDNDDLIMLFATLTVVNDQYLFLLTLDILDHAILLGESKHHGWSYISMVLKVSSKHEHLTRYVELRVAHEPGMPRTFSPPLWVTGLDIHHGPCVTHGPRCMPGSLTSGFLWSRWRGRRSRHSRRMCNPQFYASGKRPLSLVQLDTGAHLYFWSNISLDFPRAQCDDRMGIVWAP